MLGLEVSLKRPSTIRMIFAASSVRHSGSRLQSGTAVKPRVWTVKDRRPHRQRVAKTKRLEYMSHRKAEFAKVQDEAEAMGLDWAIKSAVVLERLEIIVADFADWQRDMWELQARQNFYNREYPAESGMMDTTAQLKTFEELLAECPVPLAPRRTPEDESDDRTSLNRALDQRLVLIVKPRTGDPWCLPESPWEAGETIRQAAERTAGEFLVKSATTPGHPDDVAQLYFVGNCPAGWFWRAPGKEQSEPRTYYGEKVFLNRAQLIRGTPAFIKAKVAEHLWVTKDEIAEYLGEWMGEYVKRVL